MVLSKPDNSISWFETTSRYDKGVESDDVDSFLKEIDCYVMGGHALMSWLWLYQKTTAGPMGISQPLC